MRQREKTQKQRNDFETQYESRSSPKHYESEPAQFGSRNSANKSQREKSKGKRWEQLYELVSQSQKEQITEGNEGVHAKSSGGRAGRRPRVHLPAEDLREESTDRFANEARLH